MNNNFIIMGPAGSGKGTQAKLLSEKYSIPTISIGDLLRQMAKQDTELGRKVKELIDNGILVPNDITNQVILDRLNRGDCKNGFILDGFPREIEQAEFLEKHRQLKKAIFVEVNDEECIKRISARRVCAECKADYNLMYIKPRQEGICDACGGVLIHRDDDKPEAIKNRLDIYHEQTEPVLDYYDKKGILLRINGEQSVEKVFEDLVAGLETK